MIFLLQMRWVIEGRLTFDQMWDLQVEEAQAAHGFNKVISMYKVAGQRRVIAIVELESADQLDQLIMGHLPLREYLEFEAIWPLREFSNFIEDCKSHFGKK